MSGPLVVRRAARDWSGEPPHTLPECHGAIVVAAARWSSLVEGPAVLLRPLPALPPAADDRVVDLAARRAAAQAAVRAAAEAPVRHLPAALLDALQGSWGTAEELLGVRAAPVRLSVAR